jgi:hypothetical protein
MLSPHTDYRQIPDPDAPGLSRSAARVARFIAAIIEAATARAVSTPWPCAVTCIAHVGRKLCRQHITVALVCPDEIQWACPRCGAEGTISGFIDTPKDLSGFVPKGVETVPWGFDEKGRLLLDTITTGFAELRCIVARASPDGDGFYSLEATVDELDELYSLGQLLRDRSRHPDRLAMLWGMLRSLSSAIDGF